MNWHDYITSDKKILMGKPIIKGTRISVEFLLNLLAEGWSIDDVLNNYPHLTKESIKAVFAFISDCIKDEKILDLNMEKVS